MQPKFFIVFISILIFLFVVESIRRQKMTFKYSLFWLSTTTLVTFFAFNHNLLSWFSEAAGFSLPSNFIFFLILVFFVILSLLLTIYINEQNNRTETLAQTLALLEVEIRTLQEKGVQAQDKSSNRNRS